MPGKRTLKTVNPIKKQNVIEEARFKNTLPGKLDKKSRSEKNAPVQNLRNFDFMKKSRRS